MTKERLAKAVAAVRETAMTNMFDRSMVIELADMLGYEDEAHYLREHINEYGEILVLSGKY